jgi:drug/metabolite transporter (DMT)-like permease
VEGIARIRRVGYVGPAGLSTTLVYLILLLGIAASSSAAVLIKLCQAPPLAVAAWRMTFAAAILIPWALARHRTETLQLVRSRNLPLLASGVVLAVHFATWISSLSHTSVASSALLVTTNPIFVGLGAWLLLKEHMSRQLITGTAIALVGTFWISYSDLVSGDHALFGDFLAVAGAVAMSGHLLIGRQLRQRVSLTPYITVVYTTAAIVLLLATLGAGHSLTGYSSRDFSLFFALALGPQLLGHTSFNFALKRISPGVLALLLLAEPIGSSLLAYVILHEVPPSSTWVGGSIILLGVVIALLGTGPDSQKEKGPT